MLLYTVLTFIFDFALPPLPPYASVEIVGALREKVVKGRVPVLSWMEAG